MAAAARRLPAWPAGRRWCFEEFARRRGDFALYYDIDSVGRAANAHVGVIGACTCPHRLAAVESILNGRTIDAATIAAAAKAASAAVDPPADMHDDAAYRRGLVATLVERALARAAAR